MNLPSNIIDAALKANAAHLDKLLIESAACLQIHRGEPLSIRQQSELYAARVKAGAAQEALVNAVLREGLANG